MTDALVRFLIAIAFGSAFALAAGFLAALLRVAARVVPTPTARQRGAAALPLLLLLATAPAWAWLYNFAVYFLGAALAVVVIGAVLWLDNWLCVRRRERCERDAVEHAQYLRSLTAAPDLKLWHDTRGQDVAEYAVMLAVILVLVIGTVRLVGGNANNVFSQVGSNMQ